MLGQLRLQDQQISLDTNRKLHTQRNFKKSGIYIQYNGSGIKILKISSERNRKNVLQAQKLRTFTKVLITKTTLPLYFKSQAGRYEM